MEIWNVHWSSRNDSVTMLTTLQCNANSAMPYSVYQYHSLRDWVYVINIHHFSTFSISFRSHKFNSPFHDITGRMVSTSLLPSNVRIVEVIQKIWPYSLQSSCFIQGWTKRWIAEWEDCRPNKCQSRIHIQTCRIWSFTCWSHRLCESQVGSPDGRPQVRYFRNHWASTMFS